MASEKLIEENLERIEESKPLSMPLAKLGKNFKKKYRQKQRKFYNQEKLKQKEMEDKGDRGK